MCFIYTFIPQSFAVFQRQILILQRCFDFKKFSEALFKAENIGYC